MHRLILEQQALITVPTQLNSSPVLRSFKQVIYRVYTLFFIKKLCHCLDSYLINADVAATFSVCKRDFYMHTVSELCSHVASFQRTSSEPWRHELEVG